MTGIIIIVAIALAVAAIGITLHWVQTKAARSRPDSHERKPQPPGAVGRVGKTHGP
jgi:flagellar basal body-associated protein FliL